MSHPRRIFEHLKAGADANSLLGNELVLSPDNSHHLCNVLRLSTGAEITVVALPSGLEFQAIITILDKPRVTAKLTRLARKRKVKNRVGTLAFALTKGDTTDLVCEKCVELGVDAIVFWQADHSVSKLKEAADREKRLARWKKIAESAAKQSEQNALPELVFAQNLALCCELLKSRSRPGDTLLHCSLDDQAIPLRELTLGDGQAHLIVGPEGDFSAQEDEVLTKLGYTRTSLGSNILRSETAAISAVAALTLLWPPLS